MILNDVKFKIASVLSFFFEKLNKISVCFNLIPFADELE